MENIILLAGLHIVCFAAELANLDIAAWRSVLSVAFITGIIGYKIKGAK